MKRLTALLFITTFAAGALSAQTLTSSDSTVMSLHDCMTYALKNSREAKIQESKNDQYRVQHREATLQWVPEVSGQSQAYTSFGRSIDPETNTYTTTSSFYNQYRASASYTLFNGFSVVNNYRISKIATLSGVEEAQQIEDNICLQTIQAYYNVLYSYGMVDITRKKLEDSRETLRQAQIMEEIGTKGHADVLQVEAQVAEDDYNYLKEKNTLDGNILTLKKVMFYPVEQSLVIDTVMSSTLNPLFNVEPTELIFTRAKSFLPSIQLAQNQEEQARLRWQTAKYQILPSLYASAGLSTTYNFYFDYPEASVPFFDQLKNNLGEYVAVQIDIPIFNALSRHNTRANRKNDYRIAQFQKEQKLQEVYTEIQRAVQDMEGASKEYILADKRVDAQEIAYRANYQKYKEGLISILDLQTSSNNLLSARAQSLYSALAFMLKTKIVNYYNGTPYLSQE